MIADTGLHAVDSSPGTKGRRDVQRREVVFSLFPGTFAAEMIDEDFDSEQDDRILVVLIFISAICLALTALIAQ